MVTARACILSAERERVLEDVAAAAEAALDVGTLDLCKTFVKYSYIEIC